MIKKNVLHPALHGYVGFKYPSEIPGLDTNNQFISVAWINTKISILPVPNHVFHRINSHIKKINIYTGLDSFGLNVYFTITYTPRYRNYSSSVGKNYFCICLQCELWLHKCENVHQSHTHKSTEVRHAALIAECEWKHQRVQQQRWMWCMHVKRLTEEFKECWRTWRA